MILFQHNLSLCMSSFKLGFAFDNLWPRAQSSVCVWRIIAWVKKRGVIKLITLLINVSLVIERGGGKEEEGHLGYSDTNAYITRKHMGGALKWCENGFLQLYIMLINHHSLSFCLLSFSHLLSYLPLFLCVLSHDFFFIWEAVVSLAFSWLLGRVFILSDSWKLWMMSSMSLPVNDTTTSLWSIIVVNSCALG